MFTFHNKLERDEFLAAVVTGKHPAAFVLQCVDSTHVEVTLRDEDSSKFEERKLYALYQQAVA